MALSDEDKKEMLDLMSDAFALGISKFRSTEEEKAAKEQQGNTQNNGGTGDNNDQRDSRFSVAGYLLGQR